MLVIMVGAGLWLSAAQGQLTTGGQDPAGNGVSGRMSGIDPIERSPISAAPGASGLGSRDDPARQQMTTVLPKKSESGHESGVPPARPLISASRSSSNGIERMFPRPRAAKPEGAAESNTVLRAAASMPVETVPDRPVVRPKNAPVVWTISWRNKEDDKTAAVVLYADGRAYSLGDKALGTWEKKDDACVIHWLNDDFTLRVEADGRRMSGRNRKGSEVTAVRDEP